jgi:putative Mn2+ efflux pump MntP
MNLSAIILIAVGLAMDSFAVSIANGLVIKGKKSLSALKFGITFGLFQMFMPVAGWLSGRQLRYFIQGVDHWIAFVLLVLIGAKMIYEALNRQPKKDTYDSLGWIRLLGQAIATSMDALAVGVSFAFLDVSIIFPVIIIGLITFLMSYAGVLLGDRFGHLFENKIEIVGGIILICIGIKILIGHVG